LACAAIVAALPALPAGAASQNVTVSDDVFSPGNVTVSQGESVTWNNTGNNHNVRFDGEATAQPPTPSSSSWSTTRTFLSAGTFRYYCEAHGGPGGQGMSGTVTVLPPGVPPPPPPPTVSDKSAPALKLSGKSTQRVLKQRGVRLVVRVDEPAGIVARGRVSTSRVVRSRTTKTQLRAAHNTKIKVAFSKKGLRTLRSALHRRSRLTARLTVTATDKAGNKRTLKSKFSLRR
jgi:plastocyanin